jgi:hypothetical protein
MSQKITKKFAQKVVDIFKRYTSKRPWFMHDNLYIKGAHLFPGAGLLKTRVTTVIVGWFAGRT